jgi:hypothetical protein
MIFQISSNRFSINQIFLINMEITFDGSKVITAHLNDQVIRTDQSEKSGGQNSAPALYDLFLA